MRETKCINMVVTNCDDIFIEYEWKTVNDFILDMESDKEEIPMLDDNISTLWVYRCSFNEEDLQEKGIVTVNDFYNWCKELPKVNENEYWTNERKCVIEAETRKHHNRIYSLVLKKNRKYFLVEDESINSWLYECQGYEFRGFINQYGSFEND